MSDATITALGPVPLALLPVRLETRYVGPPDAPTELRVRVYPDQIHVDAPPAGADRRRGGDRQDLLAASVGRWPRRRRASGRRLD